MAGCQAFGTTVPVMLSKVHCILAMKITNDTNDLLEGLTAFYNSGM